jgi:hypothetical protein
MKRLSIVFCGILGLSIAAPALAQPPGPSVPILFDDHTVVTPADAPNTIADARVLTALQRGPIWIVPARSMFEGMGATVSYDGRTKTVDVSKPGSDIQLTVGKPEVIVDGEARPLDVPPEIEGGLLYVPVRVIAEGLGGYVQWVPEKHVVVVRYVVGIVPTAKPAPAFPTPGPLAPAPPPVAAPPPPPPAAAPSPAPPVVIPDEHFIIGDFIVSPKVYNEFSPGNTGSSSFAVRGAAELPIFGLPFMISGDYNSYGYPYTGLAPVTVIGGYGQVDVRPFAARDTDVSGTIGLRVSDPRVYIGVGYLSRQENYGYPQQGGFGFGAEKLPDLNQAFSVYGSVWYYPSISGDFTLPAGAVLPFITGEQSTLESRFLKYQVGATVNLGATGLFLDAGFLGDSIRGGNLSPSDATHAGGYVGLGFKF